MSRVLAASTVSGRFIEAAEQTSGPVGMSAESFAGAGRTAAVVRLSVGDDTLDDVGAKVFAGANVSIKSNSALAVGDAASFVQAADSGVCGSIDISVPVWGGGVSAGPHSLVKLWALARLRLLVLALAQR